MNRLGLSEIQELVNPTVFEIIHAFDTAPNKQKLVNIINEIYSPADILGDINKRKILIEHLQQNQILEFADLLKIKSKTNDNIWDLVIQKRFSSKNQKGILYDFFGVSIPCSDIQIHDEDLSHSAASEEIEPEYPLFDHQETAIADIRRIFENNDRVLLHMPTGSGKTRTTMNIICDFLRTTLRQRSDRLVIWLADTEELCDQACEEFSRAWKYLGSNKACLYRLYGNYDLSLDDMKSGFLVAGLAKIRSCFKADQVGKIKFAKKCSLVVFDEAHKIVAPTYSNIVELLQAVSDAKLLGLSATPGRSTLDKTLNEDFATFFENNKVTLKVDGYDDPIKYLETEGYLAKIKYHDMSYTSEYLVLNEKEIQSIAEGEEVSSRILEEIGRDTKRNIKILQLALDLVEKRKKIILFACSVSHAEALFALLRYKGIKVGLVSSKTDKDLRRKIINDYKNNVLEMIINYGVLTTGFDDPKTNTAIIARPTTSLTLYSQMVGRASRGIKVGGNKTSDVHTVIDEAIPGFRDLSKAFSHWDKEWGENKKGIMA